MNSDVAEKENKVKPDENAEHYFSQNIFDEGYVDPNEEPPEPIFTETELNTAKKEAFDSGKQEGVQQTTQKEQASREQTIAKTLGRIANSAGQLFAEEENREQRFQAESVALALEIFESLFPVYGETLGFENMKHHIQDVLKRHYKTPTIDIYVAEPNVGGVQEFLNDLVTKQGYQGVFQVHPDQSLDESGCRISWPQGGSYFNNKEMAEEIRAILAQTLAGTGINRHDNNSDDINADSDDEEALSNSDDNPDNDQDLETEVETPDE